MYHKFKQSHRRITVLLRSANAEFLGHHPNKGVPEKVFAKIIEHYPSYQTSKNRIELLLPFGHPDLDSFLELAKSLSLNIEPNRATKSQVEIMDYTKGSESQISSAKYLECDLLTPIFDNVINLDPDGNTFACLDKVESASDQAFGSLTNLPHLLFIRGSAKSQLESIGLRGLKFSFVPTDDKDGKWPLDIEPLYLISSSVVFPHVDMKVFDDMGHICAASQCAWGDKERWYPLDGYEVRPLLKYQYPLPNADIALSKERFGGSLECYRRIIYSQKAKSALEEIGMSLDWVPVNVREPQRFIEKQSRSARRRL
jgi:hypothetical protein